MVVLVKATGQQAMAKGDGGTSQQDREKMPQWYSILINPYSETTTVFVWSKTPMKWPHIQWIVESRLDDFSGYPESIPINDGKNFSSQNKTWNEPPWRKLKSNF